MSNKIQFIFKELKEFVQDFGEGIIDKATEVSFCSVLPTFKQAGFSLFENEVSKVLKDQEKVEVVTKALEDYIDKGHKEICVEKLHHKTSSCELMQILVNSGIDDFQKVLDKNVGMFLVNPLIDAFQGYMNNGLDMICGKYEVFVGLSGEEGNVSESGSIEKVEL